MIKFEIPGSPKAKQRPRIVKGHAFTPKATIEYEKLVKACYLKSKDKFKYEKEPLVAKITAYYSIPKNDRKDIKKAKEIGRIRPQKTPDADNIAKIVLDGLNGIAYNDDKQIVELKVEKYYSSEPRVVVEIYEV